MALIRHVACVTLCIITRDDVPDARYRELAARPEYAAIGEIVRLGTSGAGTGELIAPRWVITAAHVVQRATPDSTWVRFGDRRIAVRRIVPHPRYAGTVNDRPFARTAFDLALLELAGDAPVPPLAVEFAVPVPGETATLVGFGVGGPGARDTAGTKRAARNRIDQVGGTHRGAEIPANVVLLDFDGPSTARNALGGGEPEALEGIASGGDSGGALLVRRGDREVLVATFATSSVNVAAAIARDFSGTINAFVGLAPHRDWIESVLRGSEPGRR